MEQSSNSSNSSEESFDPMKSKVREFQYYRIQQELKEKEEK